MKLNPDGSVEGTPQECADFKRIVGEQSTNKSTKEDYIIRTPLVGFIQYPETDE